MVDAINRFKEDYSGQLSRPDHHRAGRFLDGFGGVLSFELEGDTGRAEVFIKNTALSVS